MNSFQDLTNPRGLEIRTLILNGGETLQRRPSDIFEEYIGREKKSFYRIFFPQFSRASHAIPSSHVVIVRKTWRRNKYTAYLMLYHYPKRAFSVQFSLPLDFSLYLFCNCLIAKFIARLICECLRFIYFTNTRIAFQLSKCRLKDGASILPTDYRKLNGSVFAPICESISVASAGCWHASELSVPVTQTQTWFPPEN